MSRSAEFVSFDAFEILPEVNRIIYRYSLNDKIHFQTALSAPLQGKVNEQNWPYLQATAFSLGLCLLAYIYCPFSPPLIRVRAGKLDKKQLYFWETLYNEGLLEHFYLQQIDVGNGIQIVSEPGTDGAFLRLPDRHFATPRVLAALGLGKDCAVLAELLKTSGVTPVWAYFEEYPGEFASARRYADFVKASGVDQVHLVAHDFWAREQLRHLGRYANTEETVIYSCLYTFSSVLLSILYGYNTIVVGNERSANLGNLIYQGRPLNHQIEKSLRFERFFDQYIRTYLAADIHYFSGLMHLWELQIVQKFCTFTHYHPYFMSCNQPVGEQWCNRCPKCLQTYILCSAFLEQRAVATIFGENLLEKAELLPIFQDLLGLGAHKPLECVATPEEICAALFLTTQQLPAGAEPPYLLQMHQAEIQRGQTYLHLLSEIGSEHNMPAWYYDIVVESPVSSL